MSERRDYYNIGILSVCHALFMTTNLLSIAIASLASQALLSDASYATLPQAMIPIVAMAATIPASYLMRRIGRRGGFLLGALAGIASGALCSYALYIASFPLFLVGVSFLGLYQAFATFYRFAVADQAEGRMRSKAVSLVLAGGVIAAVLGPSLAGFAKDLFAPVLFMGSYVATIAVSALALLLLLFIRLPKPKITQGRSWRGGLSATLKNPQFLIGSSFCAVGNGTMMFVMTATPLAMMGCGFSVGESSLVISWHALAMFIPSFFTGNIINRVGLYPVMVTGLVLMVISANIGAFGIEYSNFAAALVLCGLGWNFMFVGGSTLLAGIGDAGEKAMVQGVNEFATFGVTAVGTFASGAVFAAVGWTVINVISAAAIGALLIALFWTRQRVFAPS